MIIVTGGAGFIGSHLVAEIETCLNADVVVVDHLGDGDKWRNLAKRCLHDFVFPSELDSFLAARQSSIEAVIHMGAISATTVSDGDAVMQNNFQLSRRLWDWCTTHRKRLIYASSAATYGDGSNGFEDKWDTGSLAKLQPLNLYGWSKHAFDRFVAAEIEKNRPQPAQWIGLKFFNVYGPNEYHKGSMKSVIAHLYPHIAKNDPAKLFRSYRADVADGEQLRDFVYVKDCSRVVAWLLKNDHVNGIFNVGTGKARSFRDLAKATIKSANSKSQIEYIEMPVAIREKYQYFTESSNTRLRDAGYDQSSFGLEEGVTDYVTNYLAQQDPYF